MIRKVVYSATICNVQMEAKRQHPLCLFGSRQSQRQLDDGKIERASRQHYCDYRRSTPWVFSLEVFPLPRRCISCGAIYRKQVMFVFLLRQLVGTPRKVRGRREAITSLLTIVISQRDTETGHATIKQGNVRTNHGI
jgi:hypothetical protein